MKDFTPSLVDNFCELRGFGFRLLPLHSALLLPPHHKQLDVSKSQHNSKGMNKITLGGGFAVVAGWCDAT